MQVQQIGAWSILGFSSGKQWNITQYPHTTSNDMIVSIGEVSRLLNVGVACRTRSFLTRSPTRRKVEADIVMRNVSGYVSNSSVVAFDSLFWGSNFAAVDSNMRFPSKIRAV